MAIQHVRMKIPIAWRENPDPGAFIRVFHSWIQEQLFDELLIDVADYRHVPDGPVVLLIAHEADYGVDCTKGDLGFYYERKKAVEGGDAACLAQALRALLAASERLETETEIRKRLEIDRSRIDLRICDRALAPNTPETFAALEPTLRTFFDEALGGRVEITHTSAPEPRELFGVRITVSGGYVVGDVMGRLPG